MRLFALSVLVGVSSQLMAGDSPVGVFEFPEPDLDRWEYPFNTSTLGFRTEIPTFSAIGGEIQPPFSFDQRDGQFSIRFATGELIAPGETPCGYTIERAVVRVQISTNNQFEYDPTYDSYVTYLDPMDGDFMPDGDAGRPLEIYGTSFRNDFTAESFVEGSTTEIPSPFSSSISSDSRTVFPIDFVGGNFDDVSNNVRDRFDPVPFAIGTTETVAPGEFVPFDTVFEFEMEVDDVDVQAYLRDSLDSGNLMLLVTSLSPATGVGGPGTGMFPSYYSKENIFGNPASLEITLGVPLVGDANLSGAVDFSDLVTILFQFGREGGLSDVNCSGMVDFADLVSALFNFS